MNQAVKTIEHEPSQTLAPVTLTPMEMIGQAITSGASIEMLEKLMGLHERWEANQARKDFDEAVAAAKSEMKPVVKNSQGHNSKRYADFATIARAVDPIITKHGLSYRFRTDQGERISVTCVLSHRSGHSETTTLSGPADTSGNKNAIQAIGSTLAYLQRYSLVQMLGLAASDDDDGDGAGAGEKISDEQLQELNALMVEVKADTTKFLKYLKLEALADLPAKKFNDAIAALESKRAK